MKKVMLIALLGISASLVGSAPKPASQVATGRPSLFYQAVKAVKNAMSADNHEFDRCIKKVKRIFKEGRPLDVDFVLFLDEHQKQSGSASLGDHLNRVAFGETTVWVDPYVGRSNAQIILALVANHRRVKDANTHSHAILRMLIDEAIKSLEGRNSTDLTDEVFFLERYFKEGDFAGPYDLRKIPVSSLNKESLKEFFERESKQNVPIARIYKLLKSTQEAIAAQTSSHEQLGVKKKGVESSAKKKGWRSYLTSRNFMVAGGLCCIAALIYKNYRAHDRQEVEKSFSSIE